MPTVQTTKVYNVIQGAMDGGKKIVSLQGSTRSSKTYNTLIWLVGYLLSHKNIRLSIVRKTLPSIKGSVYIDFIEILYKFGVFDRKCLNLGDLTYHFANGSFVEFFSTDDEQKIRGRKRDILFCNEANEISFMAWTQLRLRTTLFTIIDYNPSFPEDHWIETDVNKDPRCVHQITTYKDNPFLEQDVIDEIESLEHKNKSLWQIYGLGLRCVVEGLIFKHITLVEEIPEHIKWHREGIDYGFTNDPTAGVHVAIEGDKLYIDEDIYATQMLAKDIIKALKEKANGRKIISESADPRLVSEIYNAGLNIHSVKKPAGSIMAGLSKMLEYDIYVTKRSLNVIKEFKYYTYMQDRNGKWLNEPIDDYNHAIDATRYVIYSEILGGSRRKMNLSKISKLV